MEILRLRSSVKQSVIRAFLFRGTLLALLGVILLFGSLFLPGEFLVYLGLPILIITGLLFLFGLKPYRKIVQLENNPNELRIIGEKEIQWLVGGKVLMIIPATNLEKFSYLEKGNRYGIGFWLKRPLAAKLIIFDSQFDLEKMQAQSFNEFKCDLFFPYFTKKSAENLMNYYNPA